MKTKAVRDKIDQLAHINEWDEKAFPDHQDFPSNLKNPIFRVKTAVTEAVPNYGKKCGGHYHLLHIIDGIPDMTTQSGAKVGRYASPEDLYHAYLSTLENTSTCKSIYKARVFPENRQKLS
nr:unnamed protein product [Callosobruchus chinensis]